MNFTQKQQRLIDRCKKTGYGWRKFAESVERGGQCSPKQEETLVKMVQRIDTAESQRALWARGRRSYKHTLTDCEIMSFGLYI